MAGKTRGPHKEGCACVVCKAKRGGVKVVPSSPPERPFISSQEKGVVTTHIRYQAPPPPPVRLDSLLNTAKFMLEGREHRVGEKVETMVVCYNLFSNEIVTLSGATMVEPI